MIHSNYEAIDILLVEDNPYDAEMTLRSLQKKHLGNPVEWVKDGAEALDFIFGQGAYANRAHLPAPRLILLDIKLPKISGIEVLKKIKADPALKTIPVVILTSSAEDQDLLQSYELGVNSYIVKPVDFEKFQEEVAKVGFYWMLMNQTPSH